jgi:hypothetical protein
MWTIEMRDERATRNRWLKVEGAAYKTEQEASLAAREAVESELRNGSFGHRTHRYRVAVAT